MRRLTVQFIFVLVMLVSTTVIAGDWAQFRGPNASGLAETKDLPVEFGPQKNVIWRIPLPAGHSSPVLTQDRIFLTGYDEQNMLVFGLDRSSGKLLWRREIARPRKEELHKANSPAS